MTAHSTGGKAAGGQLVDQRFCPRIVEGQSLEMIWPSVVVVFMVIYRDLWWFIGQSLGKMVEKDGASPIPKMMNDGQHEGVLDFLHLDLGQP